MCLSRMNYAAGPGVGMSEGEQSKWVRVMPERANHDEDGSNAALSWFPNNNAHRSDQSDRQWPMLTVISSMKGVYAAGSTAVLSQPTLAAMKAVYPMACPSIGPIGSLCSKLVGSFWIVQTMLPD